MHAWAHTHTHSHPSCLRPRGDQSSQHPSQMSTHVGPCGWGLRSPPGWGPPARSSVAYRKSWNPRSSETRDFVKQLELSWGYLWSLFFPLTVNIHTFTAEILMYLHTEDCSGPMGIIISVVRALNYPSGIWNALKSETHVAPRVSEKGLWTCTRVKSSFPEEGWGNKLQYARACVCVCVKARFECQCPAAGKLDLRNRHAGVDLRSDS